MKLGSEADVNHALGAVSLLASIEEDEGISVGRGRGRGTAAGSRNGSCSGGGVRSGFVVVVVYLRSDRDDLASVRIRRPNRGPDRYEW